ncbi:hypothetical protein Tco_1281426, partial [Tanacetum coccineum]
MGSTETRFGLAIDGEMGCVGVSNDKVGLRGAGRFMCGLSLAIWSDVVLVGVERMMWDIIYLAPQNASDGDEVGVIEPNGKTVSSK